jgi:hypothetical protein
MKKLSIVSLLAVMGFSSCKKDFNCVCDYAGGGTSDKIYFIIEDSKKKDATASCEEHNIIATYSNCQLY